MQTMMMRISIREARVAHRLRIGAQVGTGDPFWVQVREAVYERAQQLAIELVPIDIDDLWALSNEERLSLLEELLAQDIDGLVCGSCPDDLAWQLLELGRPIIHLTEHYIRHPLFVSPLGLYDVAHSMGKYVAQKLAGRGNILILGGLLQKSSEEGGSRVAGFRDAMSDFPQIRLQHLPSLWDYEDGYTKVYAAPWQPGEHFDAIFGLSDSLALAGRDAGRALGLADEHTLIAGVNGDPLALAAIVSGRMDATIETSAADLGRQVVDLAQHAALGRPLPPHFSYKPRLVTRANVAEVAAQKLVAIANLPTRLIGVNRRLEQQRLDQLETSLAISRRVGGVLDRQRIAIEIANLIRDSYGYDVVQLYLWNEREQVLTLEPSDQRSAIGGALPLAQAGLLGQAIQQNAPIFVPDMRHSHRFPSDPRWPNTISRAIVPIGLGGATLGLLDLHSNQSTQHSRQELVGLQVLADQLGVVMRNAELYSEAVQARAVAEKADQLKTRLLANVSHELRTPLNVILGYSAAALGATSPPRSELPPELQHDFQQIYRAGEHLIRVINDLLDLSRAEINELDLFPEPIDTHDFLIDVFQNMCKSLASSGAVEWRLDLPSQLPLIQADPVRLRQVLLNLLSNAHKFTNHGQIVLGADIVPPHVHLWIQDTGTGIPIDLQEQIFEPFVTGVQSSRRPEGIGLGLSIARRLVALHSGSMTLESQPGQGSTFHIYLPLPSLSGRVAVIRPAAQPTLVIISAYEQPVAPVRDLCQRQGWEIARLHPGDDLHQLLRRVQPIALAWDLAHAGQSDWDIIQQIRELPQLGQIPLIVYGQDQPDAPDPSVGLTNFLVKPLIGLALIDMIAAMRPAAGAGAPVLIVDDDPQARQLYQGLVATALPNYPIRTAAGGAAALSVLAEETPCLVILDLIMPEIDGFTVLEHLRAEPSTRRIPVLVMSGRTLSREDIQRLDHSFVTFQSKEILSPSEAGASFQRALAVTDALPQQTSALVKQAIAYLQERYMQPISRRQLAAEIGVNKDYLSHIFHQELGISPWDYLNRYRVRQAKLLLRDTNQSITEIATQVGFEDLSYFSRVFNKHAGCSPRAYREQI
jgi:signal transduction histidine kinase/AraC-like DNA-binding protein/ABC-type sugar transport system substrate-binding protein